MVSVSRQSTAEIGPEKDPGFEQTGGALCLDLANTVNNRLTAARELLGSYEDLLAWAEQAGVVTAEEGAALRSEAARRPADAQAALEGARALREAIFAAFSAVARGQAAPAGALAMLDAALGPSLARRRIEVGGGRFTWGWRLGDGALDALLAPVVESAAALLTSADLSRVRECESETCGWLFIDRSRNQSRRWCDMSVCGNRAKVRRHYARTKGAGRAG
jgi:predicted RNA-binding Zn ribbon-like protein